MPFNTVLQRLSFDQKGWCVYRNRDKVLRRSLNLFAVFKFSTLSSGTGESDSLQQ